MKIKFVDNADTEQQRCAREQNKFVDRHVETATCATTSLHRPVAIKQGSSTQSRTSPPKTDSEPLAAAATPTTTTTAAAIRQYIHSVPGYRVPPNQFER